MSAIIVVWPVIVVWSVIIIGTRIIVGGAGLDRIGDAAGDADSG